MEAINNNRTFNYLKVGYLCLIICLLFINVVDDLDSKIKTVFQIATLSVITAIHTAILIRKEYLSEARKAYLLLTGLWWTTCFNLILARTSYFNKISLFFESAFISLFHITLLLVSISFIARKPFWYVRSRHKMYMIVGLLLLTFSFVVLVKILPFFIDIAKITIDYW